KLLTTAERDGAIVLRDPRTGREVRRWAGHEGQVSALAFSPDAQFLASASAPAREENDARPGSRDRRHGSDHHGEPRPKSACGTSARENSFIPSSDTGKRSTISSFPPMAGHCSPGQRRGAPPLGRCYWPGAAAPRSVLGTGWLPRGMATCRRAGPG